MVSARIEYPFIFLLFQKAVKLLFSPLSDDKNFELTEKKIYKYRFEKRKRHVSKCQKIKHFQQ